MNVHFNTTHTQTLMPIVIDIEDSPSQPILVVKPENPSYSNESFSLEAKQNAKGYQVNFWLEQAGNYTVQVIANDQTQSTLIQIKPHIFLPFSIEFGTFIVTLIFAFVGVSLWLKKTRSQQKKPFKT